MFEDRSAPSGRVEGSAQWSQRRLCHSRQSDSFVHAELLAYHTPPPPLPPGSTPPSVEQRLSHHKKYKWQCTILPGWWITNSCSCTICVKMRHSQSCHIFDMIVLSKAALSKPEMTDTTLAFHFYLIRKRRLVCTILFVLDECREGEKSQLLGDN